MLVACVEINMAIKATSRMHRGLVQRGYVPVQVWLQSLREHSVLWFEGLEFGYQTLCIILSARGRKTRRIGKPVPLLPSVSRQGANPHFVIVVPVWYHKRAIDSYNKGLWQFHQAQAAVFLPEFRLWPYLVSLVVKRDNKPSRLTLFHY